MCTAEALVSATGAKEGGRNGPKVRLRRLLPCLRLSVGRRRKRRKPVLAPQRSEDLPGRNQQVGAPQVHQEKRTADTWVPAKGPRRDAGTAQRCVCDVCLRGWDRVWGRGGNRRKPVLAPQRSEDLPGRNQQVAHRRCTKRSAPPTPGCPRRGQGGGRNGPNGPSVLGGYGEVEAGGGLVSAVEVEFHRDGVGAGHQG